MKRLILTAGIFLLLVGKMLPAYAQAAPDDLIGKLRKYNQAHITEKAYLHFDKPYYAAGDTIYFKAYVTMGERHDLSKLSGVLHADLIDPKNKIAKGIKLQLVGGVTWGDFTLPDSLPAGNYRVRAYTQWMLNSGNDNCFNKIIPVGALSQKNVPESINRHTKQASAKPDLQFFPEGGELVAGVASKVAFKALDINGLGTPVSGDIVDNSGQTVTTFRSMHLGMGYFWLKPESGKTYSANITFSNGAKDAIALPKINENGITLTVNNDSLPIAQVKIEVDQAYYQANRGKEYSLLVYSGGYATTVNCRLDSAVIRMGLIKKRLFTGITRLTLFSGNEPLCERLLFIQNFDQLALDVSTDKATYSARDKVSIQLNARTRADSVSIGHFSVSVTDEGKVPVNENNEVTILSDLLLTSDLKGYVEQPNYYFTGQVLDKLKELDLVMLTQGYRKFEWKQALSDDDKTTAIYPVERSLAINGTAESLFGKPLSKAIVSLISVGNGRFTRDTTDEKGNFRFGGMSFADTAKYVLQAVNAKGGNKTKLTYEIEKPLVINRLPVGSEGESADTLMRPYMDNDQKVQEQQVKPDLNKIRMLKEVKINDYRSSNILGPGHADQVLHEKDFGDFGGDLSTRLNGLLHGVTIFNGHPSYHGKAMNIYLDYVQIGNMTNINPNDIETVEVLTMATASIYGVNGGNGVLILTSKAGHATSIKDIASIGVLPIAVPGFYKARTFYSPKYDASVPKTGHPDLRSTIYWQPELVTGKDGKASFNFYNADGTGNYRVIVEGIDTARAISAGRYTVTR